MQRRNILFLAGSSLLLLLVAWLIAREVLLGEFSRLEAREHALHIRQLHQIMEKEREILLALAQDWAAWDDLYRFAQKPTPEFIKSNFAVGGVALSGLDIDLLLIVDRAGRTIHGEAIARDGKMQKAPPKALFHPFFEDPRFLELIGKTTGASAYVMQNGRPLLISVFPILTSENKGPSRGAVVMGRFLDEAQLRDFSARFQYPLMWSAARQNEGTRIAGETLVYQMPLPAFESHGAGALSFSERREIYAQGEHTVLALIGYFCVAIGGMIALLYFLQERFLFSRIRKLDSQVAKAPKVLRDPYRVEVEALDDEVGGLAKRINAMLEALYQKRQQELQLSHQERLAAMGKVMAIIAHEWRQPLNLVGLVLQNFKCAHDEGRLSEAYLDKQIDIGMTELMKMSATITEFGRIYRPVTHRERFDVKTLVQKAIDLTTERAAGKVAVSLEGEGVMIEGYGSEFLQAVIALLQNSLEAIEATQKAQGRIQARVFKEDGFVCVSIEDNGGGIDEALMERIFDPYFSTKGVVQGVGNGLFMVKMAVERGMGGQVKIENISEGARATLCLPTE